jgi:N-acyl-phosphatidylethanolamine-hydrolysing phospholipase D
MPHEFLRRIVLAGVVAGCVGAGAMTTEPAHHRGKRFQNNYLEFEPKGLAALIEWRVAAAREDLPRPPETATPRVAAELDFIRANAGAGPAMIPAVTWIGHASSLVQAGGVSILTDPIFSERASPLSLVGPKRLVAPGLDLAELPHIDAVLISHNHYDHLDAASIRALAAQPGGPPLFIVPLGIKRWLADASISHAVELDWWQSTRVGAVEVVFTPAQHWSGRSLGDRMETLWGGYAVFAAGFQWFFAGDTAY